MRNVRTKHIILSSLGLLLLSSASEGFAGIASYAIGQSNTRFEAEQKDRESGIVKCVPQPPVEKQLWTCIDAYGNEFKDLIITQKVSHDTKR
jgi:P pilus assembly chaperone PapD